MKYACDNQEKTSLEKMIPGTIKELAAFDSELQRYGMEVTGIRISDTTYEHICLDVEPNKEIIVQEESPKLFAILHTDNDMNIIPFIDGLHTDNDRNIIPFKDGLHKINSLDIERGLYKAISLTCSCCGTHHTVAFRGRDTRYELQEKFYLCDYCASFKEWDEFKLVELQANFYNHDRTYSSDCDRKHRPTKVRVLNPEGHFDYTHTDMLGVWNKELYMITDRPGYKEYDIKAQLENAGVLFNNYRLLKEGYIIKVVFAGIELKIRDIHGERIYTGDLLAHHEQSNFGPTVYYGMAKYDPRCDTRCAVYHGFNSFHTQFDYIKEWEIVGNIIVNNPKYTGNQRSDYESFYMDHEDFFRSL